MLVYLILNTVNCKGYIGQTRKRRVSDRWTKNLVGANKHLASARKKYGPDVFKFEILGCASSQEELSNLEKLWIITLRTYDQEYGYNMTYGGEPGKSSRGKPSFFKGKKRGISPFKGKTYTEIHGEERAAELRRNLSVLRRGTCNPFKGKTLDQIHGEQRALEIRMKQSQAEKGRWIPWNKGKKGQYTLSLEHRNNISKGYRKRKKK